VKIKFSKIIIFYCLLIVLCSFMFLSPQPVQAVEKGSVAMVIGNNDYGEDSLDNAVNDASAVATVLKQIGFEVIERHNLNRTKMTRALKDFSDRLKISKPGLFYFAGHAAQVDGHNYLIPSGLFPQDQIDLEYDSISLSRILDRMDAAHSYPNIVLLDACRNNNLTGGSDSIKKGLAALDGRKGMGIVFATSPGELTSDGIYGNSPFAEALIEALPRPGQTITSLAVDVGKRVKEKTASKQLVQTTVIDVGDFVFSPAQRQQPTSMIPVSNDSSVKSTQQLDHEFWDSVENSQDQLDYQSYLTVYPDGLYAELAKVKIRQLDSNTQNEQKKMTAIYGSAETPIRGSDVKNENLKEKSVVDVKKKKSEVFKSLSESSIDGKSKRISDQRNEIHKSITQDSYEMGLWQRIWSVIPKSPKFYITWIFVFFALFMIFFLD